MTKLHEHQTSDLTYELLERISSMLKEKYNVKTVKHELREVSERNYEEFIVIDGQDLNITFDGEQQILKDLNRFLSAR